MRPNYFGEPGFSYLNVGFCVLWAINKIEGRSYRLRQNGLFSPVNAEINFIVPDRRSLEVEEKFIKESETTIIIGMIETNSVMDREQTATYTICVDGKKINPS